jgi:hypothetical protein
MESLSEAAIAFAKECLNRPASHQVGDEIHTGEEFNLGPPGHLDATSFEVYDLQRIMQMVMTWCQHHGLHVELSYFDESYTCKIIVFDDEDGTIDEIFEFSAHDVQYESFAPCVDACYALLAACVLARRNVGRIIQHYKTLG